MRILDYFFFFILFISTANICLQVWIKYIRVNKKAVDGSKLVDTYMAVESMKKRKKHG